MAVRDTKSAQTSRIRLLQAGKTLFARKGYEHTSTATIARSAGSSESQLIRNFGGKAGLLEAIFNDSWSGLSANVESYVEGTEHGREAIIRLLSLVIQAFGRDADTAFLFLYEGRRMRGHIPEVMRSQGFTDFMKSVDAQIQRGREDGSFRADVDSRVISSAILGCAEGMMRDRILGERTHESDHPYTDEAIFMVFKAMVDGLGGSR